MVLDNDMVFGTVNANRRHYEMRSRRCAGRYGLAPPADHTARAGRTVDASARTASGRHQSHRGFFLTSYLGVRLGTHRRLRADRRLQDRRAGRPRRLDRLAMLAAFRFRCLLCRAAWQPRARPLADRAAARRRRITRRYRPNTLILETHFETDDGAATLIDFMPLGGDHSTIVRLVVGTRGKVAMRTELILRFGYGAIVPWVTRLDDGALRAIAGPDMVVLRTPVHLRGDDMTTVGEFAIDEARPSPSS